MELRGICRNETAIAYTDNDTATLIREAVITLTIFRAPMDSLTPAPPSQSWSA
jgi:hypothetical protein